jgi:hypothetical protein
MTRTLHDKSQVRSAILRAAAAAHPGTLERHDLDREPEIARADGRTVHAELRSLHHAGCIMPVDFEYPSGTITRLRATGPAATAVKAVVG